jgi:hypothetical protein
MATILDLLDYPVFCYHLDTTPILRSVVRFKPRSPALTHQRPEPEEQVPSNQREDLHAQMLPTHLPWGQGIRVVVTRHDLAKARTSPGVYMILDRRTRPISEPTPLGKTP